MKINRFLTGMIGTNSYLIINEETKECIFVDPAAYSEEIKEAIRKDELKPVAIILTHGHFDHIMGIDAILKEYDIPVYAHENEKTLLNDASMNLSAMYGKGYTFSDAIYVSDKDQIKLAGFLFEVIYTPGHTQGGCCYYCKDEDILFSGDTLFCASIGRTDFPTGSGSKLVRSVKERLLCLPDKTRVYPGHMDETTIAYEKMNNPFI